MNEPDESELKEETVIGVREGLSEEAERSTPLVKKLKAKSEVPSLEAWQRKVGEVFKKKASYGDLAKHLLDLVQSMDTPLGRFTRSMSHPLRPPPANVAPFERRGDLLPIHPTTVEIGRHGVTSQNVDWVKLTLIVLNFYYCAGWAKPICVPMDTRLSDNQRGALREIAHVIDSNIISAKLIPTLAEAKKALESKRYDYSGNPIENMMDLEAKKVFPTWPKKGEAGIRCIAEFFDGEALEAMRNPDDWLLPYDLQPSRTKRSVVRATDEEWLRICTEAHRRKMMVFVKDDVPRDKAGHLVVNGAGAVKKMKTIEGKLTELQRFISVLVPTNQILKALPGAQDSLPYIGQLTAIHLGGDEELYLESEDFSSAFNLFSVPTSWSRFFAYAKKVPGKAFGCPDLESVRPALRVIPMGWRSAVTIVQAAVRNIVYDRAKVDKSTAVQKDRPLPEDKFLSVVYLDNYDEIQIFKKVRKELTKENHEGTETRRRFSRVCNELGLPLNKAKQLIGAYVGGMQGGEFHGKHGVLKLGRDKLEDFIAISLALLALPVATEFQIRHWVGKAAFAATFRRPLFAVLQEVFELIEDARSRPQKLSEAQLDEVLTFLVLGVHAQSELKAELSPEISCADASPSGGGAAVATQFKSRS